MYVRTIPALFVISFLPVLPAAEPDAENCADSKLINRMRGCAITECRVTDHDQDAIHTGIRNDEYIDKTLEGRYEKLEFSCPENLSPVQIIRNMQNALTAAGYTQVFAHNQGSDRQYVAARKGPQWIAVESWINGEPLYTFTAILEKSVDQELEATAAAWSAELENSGRVRVYGIHFDTGNATITSDSEAALKEMLTLLNNKPDWNVLIEGHTDNKGAPASNLTLSRQRAAAVAAWLAGQGIDKGRLSTAGFGDSRPVADNPTEEGRAKNRRVEITKL